MVVMVGNDDNVRECMYHRAYRQLLLSRAGLPLLEKTEELSHLRTYLRSDNLLGYEPGRICIVATIIFLALT